MRPILLTLTLLAATTAFAQTAEMDKVKQQLNAQVELLQRTACPVGIVARHEGSPAAIWTTSLEDSNKSAAELKALHTGVHVDLVAQHKQIKQVELAVYFLPPGTRVLPVAGSQFASSPAPRSEASKNFSLTTGKSPSHQLDGDLLLGPVASITHVSLMHITFSDGTEWTAQNSTSCSREPSKFMPVEAGLGICCNFIVISFLASTGELP